MKCEKCGRKFNVPPAPFLVERIGGPIVNVTFTGALAASSIEVPDELKPMIDPVTDTMNKEGEGKQATRGEPVMGIFDRIPCDSCAFMTCNCCPIDLGGDLDDPDYDEDE